MIGRMVSHYRILEHLGGGGMGVVYKAEDTRLKRVVALKFLPPDLAHDPESKERFVHEAQAASALKHNNICVVYDIDETDDGRMFLCMEYIEGESLKTKIGRGPLEIEEAMDAVSQVARGLSKAHGHGIIHRDIKPANIMVTADNEAKVVDFGLAKLSGQSVVTRTGSTVGTAAYMSPEQARGEAVDRRTDIWSLGVILYEMLTGKRPFASEYEQALVYSILNARPEPMAALRADVPAELEEVVQKCLSKDPGERYQSADDFLAALRPHVKAGPQNAVRSQRPVTSLRPRRRLSRYGAGAGVVSLVLIALFLLLREQQPAARLVMIAVLPFENLGPAEDEYFADGLTDEITSRLSSISRLGVISRTSSVQYKRTSKTLPVVARELGVDYVLEGTIQWVKTGSSQRIRITPQLIKVSGDVHLWADNIDRTLDDIFAVETDIAMRVVTSLDIVLAENQKQVIEAIPTRNLEAYKAYLRGLSLSYRYDRTDNEGGIKALCRAVALDSTFALAYTQLSYAHLRFFWMGYDATKERVAEAKESLDRALALQSNLPEGYVALGYYYYWGCRDYDRALEAFAVAEEKLPNDSRVLRNVAYIWRRQGRFEAAIARLKKAFDLDPQGADIASEIGISLLCLGRYADAEVYLDRSIAILPDQDEVYMWKAEICLLWRGDTRKSRSELDRIPARFHPWMNYVLLDILERDFAAALNRLDRAPERTFEDQVTVTPVSQMRGLVYMFMGDAVRSRQSFDSARVYLESELKRRPDDYRLHESLGLVFAGLGRSDEAIRQAELAVQQLPISLDAMDGVNALISLAQVYTIVGKHDAAVDKLEYIISLKGHSPDAITPSLLRLDPVYDPLRSNPRFQSLLAGEAGVPPSQ